MFAAWVVFPLVLAFLSFGLGLLVERVAGASLPSPLLLPIGAAAMIVITSFGVLLVSARTAVPLVAALAVLGLALGPVRPLDVWAHGGATVVFLCFGAPVLATGTPTFAGYIKLDDTATFFALVDRAIEHGRSLGGLTPSSYEATLAGTLGHGYPLGSVLPLGVGHELVRVDIAWLFQPWLSFAAAMLALALYQLAAPLVRHRGLRAGVAVVASQPALLFGYALWGGVKELVAAALVATAVALAVELKAPLGARSVLPLAIACAATLDVLSAAGAVWLLPVGLALVPQLRRAPRSAVVGLAAVAVLGLPAIAVVTDFLRGTNRDILSTTTDLGNLIRPLRFIQVLGIWPSGDFRVDPSSRFAAGALLLLAAAAGLAGVGFALRRTALGVPLGVASALFGAVVFVVFGSPWVGGKALAIGSPFVLLAIVVGAFAVITNHPRQPVLLGLGTALVVAVVGGVAWSNVLAYHEADLAPFSQLRELERIGERFAGDGPALMTEYQPYGVRHFLRTLDPEGASELRRRTVGLRNGGTAAKAEYVDTDRIQLDDVLVYRTLVLRRSPTQSRPPAPYHRVWAGRWYDVWQRAGSPVLADHRPLGDAVEPGGRAPCSLLDRLATLGPVVGYSRPVNIVWSLDRDTLPRELGPARRRGSDPEGQRHAFVRPRRPSSCALQSVARRIDPRPADGGRRRSPGRHRDAPAPERRPMARSRQCRAACRGTPGDHCSLAPEAQPRDGRRLVPARAAPSATTVTLAPPRARDARRSVRAEPRLDRGARSLNRLI